MRGGFTSPKHLIVGAWNVRGCSGSEENKGVIGDVFDERGLDVLALGETKIKGRGEVNFGKVRGWVSGVERGHGREGVALLLSDRVIGCVMERREVSSRIMRVKMNLAGEVWVIVSVYGPGSEKSVEERETFWGQLNDCVEALEGQGKVVVLGDLNARVGNISIEGVIGNFGVDGVN